MDILTFRKFFASLFDLHLPELISFNDVIPRDIMHGQFVDNQFGDVYHLEDIKSSDRFDLG